MPLLIGLAQKHVGVACQIYHCFPQWMTNDAALGLLRKICPDFTREECLLKAVVVNILYSTQVRAIIRMARHVESVLAEPEVKSAGGEAELVKRLAALPKAREGERNNRFTSFAAKFCHFFIDDKRFHIYDDAARDAITLHLDAKDIEVNDDNLYKAFSKNVTRLHTEANLQCSMKELDHYLWLMGLYKRWRDYEAKKLQVNTELYELSRQLPSDNLKLKKIEKLRKSQTEMENPPNVNGELLAVFHRLRSDIPADPDKLLPALLDAAK